MKIGGTADKIRKSALAITPADCVFELSAIHADISFLSPGESAAIEGWANSRQQEFAAGRLCASRAMAGLGRSGQQLLRDEDGLPIWPTGLIGSITHCLGIAAAAVRPSDGREPLLGLDLERTNRLSESAGRRVVHPLERDLVGEDQIRMSVLFSLKEAFYKAQFPRWRMRGNFHDIALTVDFTNGCASVAELDRFTEELADLRFRFVLVDDHVLSFCC